MPFFYKKRGNRRDIPMEVFKQAADEVRNGRGLNEVARFYSLPKSSLCRHVRGDVNYEQLELKGMHYYKQIFSKLEEYIFLHNLITLSGVCPLDGKTIRDLAYQFAVKNQMNIPENWSKNSLASKDWMRGFFSRHGHIVTLKQLKEMSSNSSQDNIKEFFESNFWNPNGIKQEQPDPEEVTLEEVNEDNVEATKRKKAELEHETIVKCVEIKKEQEDSSVNVN